MKILSLIFILSLFVSSDICAKKRRKKKKVSKTEEYLKTANKGMQKYIGFMDKFEEVVLESRSLYKGYSEKDIEKTYKTLLKHFTKDFAKYRKDSQVLPAKRLDKMKKVEEYGPFMVAQLKCFYMFVAKFQYYINYNFKSKQKINVGLTPAYCAKKMIPKMKSIGILYHIGIIGDDNLSVEKLDSWSKDCFEKFKSIEWEKGKAIITSNEKYYRYATPMYMTKDLEEFHEGKEGDLLGIIVGTFPNDK